MGMSFQDFEKIVGFQENNLIPKNGFFVELGAQELSSKPTKESVVDLINRIRPSHAYQDSDFERIANEQYAHAFYEALGSSSISFDLAEAPHSISIDLNTDSVPKQYLASSDLTTNFGTTEHILNQFNCFRFIHDITKVGGLMWHIVPSSDYFGHGFFKYDPAFFIALCQYNDYKIIEWGMGAHCPAMHWNIPQYLYEYGMPEVKPMESIIFIVAQKRRDIPFVVPVDTPIGPSWPKQTIDLINKWQSGRIFIYGAGGLGALVATEFQKLGLEIDGFVDTFKSGTFEGRPVHKFEDYVADHHPSDRILIASLYATEICMMLREHGYGWVASISKPWWGTGI